MTKTPNNRQRTLIEATEGIHRVDAGPGTGKTFTITRRYATLLETEGVTPEDVLLVTFTENAAAEMKERVVTHCEYSMAALRDAPINTFHGLCHEILDRYGVDAPTRLGIDDHVTTTTQILDNEVLETQRFAAFLGGFRETHPEHHEFLQAVTDRTALLELVKELAAKGIVPTADGWYRTGESYLDGDPEAFRTLFAEANEPTDGANGPNQSELRSALNRFDDYTLRPEDPTTAELRAEYPSIEDAWADRAFAEDRTRLKAFVHDVYHEYLAYALGQNYLNFSFLQILAYVVLCDDHDAREAIEYEYVMVDEFQDTSEIQFKLAMLLAETENLCVVGDWKQSIYGFQYASVDNIREFPARLERYKTELNAEYDRITYPVDDVEDHSLTKNYRSTQPIIDFAEQALTVPATNSESVDLAAPITRLDATTEATHSRIEAYTSPEEHEAIVDRIQHIVGNDDYAIEQHGEWVAPTYEDIAVLTRTRDFGRELQSVATEYGVPIAYEGGVELYDTAQAKLVLAWLRILADVHPDRGWAAVLEHAGYTLDEVRALLKEDTPYPEPMRAFHNQLTNRDAVGGVVRAILDRYGFEDAYADAILTELQATFDTTHHTLGDLVRFIERSYETDATVEVADTPGGDAVTVQTIHAAKGLEHPIVVLANLNQYAFPSSGGGGAVIRYDDPVGLRQSKIVDDAHGDPHVYDNWHQRFLTKCLDRDYDEERRLLYVAITRAHAHVLFTAGADPSPFFTGLALDPTAIDPTPEVTDRGETEQTRFQVAIPEPEIPAGHSPHSLMDDAVFEGPGGDRGTEFGAAVHEFAEAYATGEPVTPENDHEANVQAFIDGLPGELLVEEHAYLPVTVDGRQVSISGIIDLVHVTEDVVEVIDYKTDATRRAAEEYRKQVSVYYHVLVAAYPDREIRCSLYWTGDGDHEPTEALPISELKRSIDNPGSNAGPKSLEEDRLR
ncbi:MAG: UvrD-helicase domain-containing protein [Halobacteriaceae archaeon]